MKKRIVITSIVFGCLVLPFAIGTVRRASVRMRATGHICFWTEAAKQSECRTEAHSRLQQRVGLHNSFVDLIDAGDKSSIPVLIDIMKTPEAAAAYASEDCPCTWGHCLEAIRVITGRTFGPDPEAWQSWWDTTGRNMPENSFSPQSRRTGQQLAEELHSESALLE